VSDHVPSQLSGPGARRAASSFGLDHRADASVRPIHREIEPRRHAVIVRRLGRRRAALVPARVDDVALSFGGGSLLRAAMTDYPRGQTGTSSSPPAADRRARRRARKSISRRRCRSPTGPRTAEPAKDVPNIANTDDEADFDDFGCVIGGAERGRLVGDVAALASDDNSSETNAAAHKRTLGICCELRRRDGSRSQPGHASARQNGYLSRACSRGASFPEALG
jgi:hypothetical protein